MSRLVSLYPRAWRERYLAELEDLLADRPPTLRDHVDIARGAFDAWIHPQLVVRPPRQEANAGPGLRHLAAGSAILGGGLWIVGGLAMNAARVDQSLGYKDSTMPWIVMIVAAVITAVGAIAIVRSRMDRSRAASITSVAMLVGALLIATPWPILVVGFFAYALTTAAFGYLAGAALPLGWLLSIAALMLPMLNTEDERALLTIPLGLAWIAVGALAARRAPAATAA
jgi:hypothetical protein